MTTAHAIAAGLPLVELELELEEEAAGQAVATRDEHYYDWRNVGGCMDPACRRHARDKQLAPPGDWRVWLLMAGRRWGKALALDTPIPTAQGWTTMADISVDDELFDERGEPCTVTYVSPIWLGRTCYEVRFSDGTSIVADEDHEWLTWDKAARKASTRGGLFGPAVRTTREIAATLMANARERNHSIAVAPPISMAETALPVPPYTLGIWLGDGSSTAGQVTLSDRDAEEILAHLADEGVHVSGPPRRERDTKCQTYPVGGKPTRRDAQTGNFIPNESLHSALRATGLLGNKHIPAAYQRASVEQRETLLRGLMDSDGSVQEGGHCEFLVTNEALARGALELIAGLGFKPTFADEPCKLYGRLIGRRYRVSFTPGRQVFGIAFKASRCDVPERITAANRRYITSALPVPSVSVRCIQVDSPSSLFLCSRSFIATHNSLSGAQWIRQRVEREGARHIAFVAQTKADARDVMVEGPSGILAVSPPWNRPLYESSKRRLTWPNGASATIFSADEPGQLRGPEHDTAWADEPAKWMYLNDPLDSPWTNMMIGLSRSTADGSRARSVATTTPRPLRIIRELLKDGDCVVTRGHTEENMANLDPAMQREIIEKYEGTRLGRQELAGEVLEDVEGALWTLANIEAKRLKTAPESIERVVVAIDPSGSDDEGASEQGIVSAGRAVCECKGKPETHYFVLRDDSGHYTPNDWGGRAISAYRVLKADRIIGEANFGGQMVEHTIKTIDKSVPYKAVTASRGKALRAEPIAALAEQGKVHHVGVFPVLEDQLCSWVPGMKSPDRLDAYVWALTELHGNSGKWDVW